MARGILGHSAPLFSIRRWLTRHRRAVRASLPYLVITAVTLLVSVRYEFWSIYGGALSCYRGFGMYPAGVWWHLPAWPRLFPRIYETPYGEGWIIPLWPIPLVAGVISFVRVDRRRTASQCPSCSYDLTGNTTGVCPECGGKSQVRPIDRLPLRSRDV